MPEGVITALLTLTLALPDGTVLTTPVELIGLAPQYQARFYWAWQAPDVAGLLPLTFTLTVPPDMPDPNPADNTLTLTIPVYSTDDLYPPEPHTQWLTTEKEGFRLHTLTDSAATRDLPALLDSAQDAYADVAAQLPPAGDEILDIYLMDRVIGQGGFASAAWVAVSYTDRMYAPIQFDVVLRHELIHRLDKAIGCENAPSLIREGLAVYLPGGHYRRESLPHKAAAVAQSEVYVPLDALLDNFYVHQHEVSYTEAGMWVGYFVETYGWEGLETLCRAATGAEGDDAARLTAGTTALGAPDLVALEAAWLDWLSGVPITADDTALLDVELRLMDTMRAYQRDYNLSAHFLEGILFDVAEAERQGIVADFVRRPREPEAIAVELLLALAQDAVRQGDAAETEAILAAITPILEHGDFTPGLAADVLALTRLALERGYEPYRLTPTAEGYTLGVLDYANWPALELWQAVRENGNWKLVLGNE